MNFITHPIEPKRLLLVWQGPEGPTRARCTVAELVRDGDGIVRFRYLPSLPDFARAQQGGFVNYPAFKKIDQEYGLGVVETFMRRLPPRSRGDYDQYLEQFRLKPETSISDFALLAYTGAKLPSDGFSIVNPLEDLVERHSPGEFLIEVAGFRYASTVPLTSVRLGDQAEFRHEPGNEHDCNAVEILVGEHRIGYVPRPQALAVWRASFERELFAHVERINGKPERPLVYLFAQHVPVARQGVVPQSYECGRVQVCGVLQVPRAWTP